MPKFSADSEAKLQSLVDNFTEADAARIKEMGSETGTADEQQIRAFFSSEQKKWAEVIRVSGAKAE